MKTDNKGMTIMEVLISVCIIAIVLILLFSLLLQVRSEDNDNNIQSTFILTQATIIKNIEEDIVDYGLRSIEQCNFNDILTQSDLDNIADKSNIYCVQLNYGDFNNKPDSIRDGDQTGILMVYEYILKYTVDDNGNVEPSKERGIVNGVKYSAWMIRYMRGNYVDPNRDVHNLKKTKDKFIAKTTVMKELPDVIIMSTKDPQGNDIFYQPQVKYSGYFGTSSNPSLNSGLLSVPIVTSIGEHYDIDVSFEYKLPDYNSSVSGCNLYKYFQCRYRDENPGFCKLGVGSNSVVGLNESLIKFKMSDTVPRPQCG